LRDYDLFHLLDYLALGLGLAGYLLLSGLPDGRWHDRRFAVLRWGIALALMWSSMEKFMYPQWFLPLLEEKPFLAFGIPFGPYTTMAGVAEFTLGFGLLWTPLVRRLSAAALFLLMFAAFFVVPIVFAMVDSLFSLQSSGLGLGAPRREFVFLDNYIAALADPSFLASHLRLVAFSAIQVPLMVLTAPSPGSTIRSFAPCPVP
jgi:uncharacterized membrane protein YphA (DoxX/SURF4 family)